MTNATDDRATRTSWRAKFRALASIAWRLVGIAAATWVVIWVVNYLRVLIVPVLLATFLASLGGPAAERMRREGFPSLLATWIVTLVGTTALVVFGWFLVSQIASSMDQMIQAVEDGWDSIQSWLEGISVVSGGTQIQDLVDPFSGGGGGGLVQRVLSGAGTAVEIVTGFLLTLFVAFFMIKDGLRFWEWVTSKVPQEHRESVRIAGGTAWATLRRFLAGTAVVGLVDAIPVAIALLVLQVPLAIPLALLMFGGAFFPLVGALTSGTIVAIVTLATNGPTDALIMVAVVIGVQQLEGHVLQPVVLGRAVSLHPVVIVLSLTLGLIAFGIVGAFLAVPVTGILSNVIRELRPAWLETTA